MRRHPLHDCYPSNAESRKPVHAIIFLFRYQTTSSEGQATDCPSHVWFANQTPDVLDGACASLALVNIVNNIPDLELGTEVKAFKSFTQGFRPHARGGAIDDFTFLKEIHNSFARELDILNADLVCQRKYKANVKRRKVEASQDAKRAAKEAKQAEKAATLGQTEIRRSTRSRKPRVKILQSDEEDDDGPLIDTDEGFHFIAYMPIDDEVWKLDGMDSFPQSLGRPEPGNDWLSVVKPVLQDRMAQYEQGQIEFSLMAVVQDRIIAARSELAANIHSLQAVQGALKEHTDPLNDSLATIADEGSVDSDLLTGMSVEYGISAVDVDTAETPKDIVDRIKVDSAQGLSQLKTELVTQQGACRAAVRDEMRSKEADAEQAMLRRHDYRPFFTQWVKALKEEGVLDVLATKVKLDA